MPIKKMQVDWNDGTNVSLDGYFRNQRGAVNGVCDATTHTCFVSTTVERINTQQSCASNNDCRYLDNCFSEAIAPNFGQIADKTCDNGFQRFDHVYQCLRDGAGWTTTCSDPQTQNLNGGCCEFQPKVQVKDNWGWCNGSCPGGVGGDGCYEKDWGSAVGWVKECSDGSIPLISPWTKFDNGVGKVIIAPQ